MGLSLVAIEKDSGPGYQVGLPSGLLLRGGHMDEAKNPLEQALRQEYSYGLIQAESEFMRLRRESWFESLMDGTQQH